MAQVSTFAIALGGSEQDIQKADHLVRQCYWAVRCLSVLLRDKLHQEGLWPDLMQEIEIAAWEAGRKGLSDRDARRLAARRLYAFVRSCGYIPYRKGYYKPEVPFASAFGSITGELQDIVVSRARPMPAFVAWWREHKDTVLTVIRESPAGISKRDLCCKLRISRRELDWQCEPMIKQVLVVRDGTLSPMPLRSLQDLDQLCFCDDALFRVSVSNSIYYYENAICPGGNSQALCQFYPKSKITLVPFA